MTLEKGKNKKRINKIALGVAGTAAAVGVTAVVLSNKNNRKKAKKAISDIKTKGTKLKDRVLESWEDAKKDQKKIQKSTQKLKKNAKSKIKTAKSNTKKKLNHYTTGARQVIT